MLVGEDRDRGDTLVEVMVAVAILGIAAVAIMAGMTLSAKISGKDRGESGSTTEVRNYAEYIASTVASGGWNDNGNYPWTPPNGTVDITERRCLTAASAKTASPDWVACPSTGNMQRLSLTATTNGVTESLTIFVRKPCGASSSC